MDLSVADYITMFCIAMTAFLVLDLTWLGFVARDFYRKQLKKYLVENFDWKPAAIFYSLFVVGLIFFAIAPAAREDSLSIAMGHGAAFGFFTYLTYDLTNLSTIKNWPKKLVYVDIAWGTFLSFSVSVISFSFFSAF